MLPREPTCNAKFHEDAGRPNHGSLWKMFASKIVVSLLLVENLQNVDFRKTFCAPGEGSL